MCAWSASNLSRKKTVAHTKCNAIHAILCNPWGLNRGVYNIIGRHYTHFTAREYNMQIKWEKRVVLVHELHCVPFYAQTNPRHWVSLLFASYTRGDFFIFFFFIFLSRIFFFLFLFYCVAIAYVLFGPGHRHGRKKGKWNNGPNTIIAVRADTNAYSV